LISTYLPFSFDAISAGMLERDSQAINCSIDMLFELTGWLWRES
jgi:hypothetical protein